MSIDLFIAPGSRYGEPVTHVREEVRMKPSTAPPRLAAAVRAARRRRGWSRERLAQECALSFAAITQIESGRRTEVRASTLVVLAEALDVSVDYLVRGEVATPMLTHRGHVLRSRQLLAEAVHAHVGEAVDAGHAALVVTTAPTVAAVRKALGPAADHVTFGISSDWYTTPAETTARYMAFVRQARRTGAQWVDILGEPVWTGRGRAEVAAWTRYESMLNVVFGSWPVRIGCLYDASAIPARVRSDLERTHPELATADGVRPSAVFEAPEAFVTR
jgi:transcriptional regulator with XRE-family HTH domain